MGRYIARRLVLLAPAWLLMGVIAFALIRLVPGDPAAVLLGMEATPEAVERLRERLGLNEPLPVQFGIWLGQVVQGELGRSFFLGEPVLQAIVARLPVTLSLAGLALLVAVLLGIPAGMHAARRPNSSTDLAVMGLAVLGLSVPDFAMGLGLMLLFGVTLRWLPISGYVALTADAVGWVLHLLMPALALGLVQGALVARITRSSLLEILATDYIRTARAKGLAEAAVMGRHAFRNALIQVLTVVGNAAVVLLGGAFVIETVFNLPGVGNLVVMAVKRRDYPLVQGCILLIATVVIVVNLVVDVLYASVDPQVRYQ
ncbi:MAG: ABC transporter permease [Armatimonadota bacterium]|nr:ABC transporter permease [Armatimonadota bacterium]MDR7485247.1 ABC transporter permease [Armatimonadota bacterium]MDR7534207.1 ABC transporter permease [Armatimonadota bacterium]MDR7537122.1 ABC transporter permease [Armatimonadota bacterium]